MNHSYEPDYKYAAKVHLVFGDSAAGSLKLALRQLGYSDTDRVVTFTDNYAIGPLWHLHQEVGRKNRGEWFRANINESFYPPDLNSEPNNYYDALIHTLSQISDAASIVIWSGSNAREQAGLRYAIHLLREYLNEIFVINPGDACSRSFNLPGWSIEYLHSGEIPPDRLKAVYVEIEDSGPLTSAARQLLGQEWQALTEQVGVLRIWNGEGICSVAEHYFDSIIMKSVKKLHHAKGNHDFIKAARVIGEVVGHCDVYIDESYIEYRLRELIYTGKLEIEGIPSAMRYYSVRLASWPPGSNNY